MKDENNTSHFIYSYTSSYNILLIEGWISYIQIKQNILMVINQNQLLISFKDWYYHLN